MDDQHLFEELLQAAERLAVEVRIEPFETPATMGGGLCVLRGEKLVLIDQRAPLPDRIRALARALLELQSETVYMAPEARELIEAIRGDWLESPYRMSSCIDLQSGPLSLLGSDMRALVTATLRLLGVSAGEVTGRALLSSLHTGWNTPPAGLPSPGSTRGRDGRRALPRELPRWDGVMSGAVFGRIADARAAGE